MFAPPTSNSGQASRPPRDCAPLQTPNFWVFLGIVFTSAATLTLQISVIRLLSVSQGNHFAFMVVSMALLGYGASGSFLSSFPSVLNRETEGLLTRAAGLFSVSALAAYGTSNYIPFDLASLSWDRNQILYLFLYYLVFSIPFFFSGMAVSSALARWSASSGKLYFSDLSGASLGCLLVLVLFGFLGGEGTLLFACLLGALAAVVFGWRRKPFFIFPWVWLGVLILLLFWQPSFIHLRLSPYRSLGAALLFPGANLLETRWNSFSRVDILESPAARTAPGLSLVYLEPLPPQVGLTVDAGQISAITHFEGRPEETRDLRFLDFLPSSLSYQLVQLDRVLILEPGGGLEVLNALRHRSKEVVAVEMNPAIVSLLRGPYGEYSGGIYRRKEVQVAMEEGRSFLRRAPPSFDLIIFPLTDSLGASSTGFSGWQEDYRLTTEALQDYLRNLKPGGFLSFTLYLLPPPRSELRLVSLVKQALERSGKDPGRHLLAFRSWGTFSLLVKESPLLPSEVESLKSFCQRLRFDLVYYPGMSPGEANIYNRFPLPLYFNEMQKVLKEGANFYSQYPFDISPVTDDRPFFNDSFRWTRWEEIYRLADGKWQILVEGGLLVPVIFLLALILSFFFIILPLARGQLPKSRGRKVNPFPWLAYFLALGFGFMFVEISLIQKFILFLGHPVYSVSLVIFSLLAFAGLGSRLSMFIASTTPQGLRFVLLVLIGLLFLSAFYLPLGISTFQGRSLLSRQLLSVLLIAPTGLLMGMPFPLGIRLVGAREPFLVPWAWAANGCASVLGSILPVIIALAWGFQVVFFLAGFLYALGLLSVWKYC